MAKTHLQPQNVYLQYYQPATERDQPNHMRDNSTNKKFYSAKLSSVHEEQQKKRKEN